MVNPAYLCKQALLLTDETEKKRIRRKQASLLRTDSFIGMSIW